jgi:Arabinose-binding domain of AraC transcription regulator, N-term
VEVVGAEARICFHWILSQEHPPTLLIDGAFASVLSVARRGTGQPLTPLRLELTRPRGNEAMLVGHFGCEVRFGTPVDLLVFDARLLPEPFTTRNEDLLAVLLLRCLRMELKPFGIDVVVIEPGGMRTKGVRSPSTRWTRRPAIPSTPLRPPRRGHRSSPRYAVGAFAKPSIFMSTFFPDRAIDWMTSRITRNLLQRQRSGEPSPAA